MMRTTLASAASLALLTGAVSASPEGLDIFVDITLNTIEQDWTTVGSIDAFNGTMHTLGGPATLLFAADDYITDVLVNSSVTTAGLQRSINIRFQSVTGGTIFRPGIENILPLEDPAVFYYLSFMMYSINDAERVSPVNYDYALLDVNGQDVHSQTVFNGFFGGFGYVSSEIPSEEFFGILVNGFEVTMTYFIPAPAASAMLALGVLGARRRR